MTLQELKHRLAKEIFDNDLGESLEQRVCINCQEPALENCYSSAGRREFFISGLCEKCFDEIMGSEK